MTDLPPGSARPRRFTRVPGPGPGPGPGRGPGLGRRGSRSAPAGLDVPVERRSGLSAPQLDPELFGRWSERFARFMGTATFIAAMTLFVAAWLVWNTWGPQQWQFDPRDLNYTLLTLILSLQASYAAPLILLAQNRQADRDRVSFEQDRQRAERALADTEYLAREIAALRLAVTDLTGLVREAVAELPPVHGPRWVNPDHGDADA